MDKKFDITSMDTSALKQALEVLNKASVDYVVIDIITQIKEELKTREDKINNN